MRFLADENFRQDVVHWMVSHGADVRSVSKQSSDKSIADACKKEDRVLLTNDIDFAMTLRFRPSEYPGILVFRMHPPSFAKFKIALEQFLNTRDARFIKGKTFLIREDSILELD